MVNFNRLIERETPGKSICFGTYPINAECLVFIKFCVHFIHKRVRQ